MEPMATYSGPVRILDMNRFLLTVGSADLESDSDTQSWGGMLRVLPGTGVAGKALQVMIQLPGGEPAEAVLDPLPDSSGVAFSEVAGVGPRPF